MQHNHVKTPFAKRTLASISSAKSLIPASEAQKSHDYFCPDCNGRVRRRVSSRGLCHFVHQDDACTGNGLETIVHLLAKEVILRERSLWIPDCIAVYDFLRPQKSDVDGQYRAIPSESAIASHFSESSKKALIRHHSPYQVKYVPTGTVLPNNGLRDPFERLEKKIPFGCIHIDTVRDEVWIEDIRADLVVTIDNRDYIVEIANTHFVDSDKLEKIKNKNLPAIEIDVSKLLEVTYESVRNLLINPNGSTTWLHYSNELVNDFEIMKAEYEKHFIDDQNEREKERVEREKKHRQSMEADWAKEEAKKEELSQINRREQSRGLPGLYGSLAQVQYAVNVRNKRIKRFGMNDLLVKQVIEAKRWIECDQKGQLLYLRPFCMTDFFEQERQRQEDKEKSSQLSNRLMPEPLPQSVVDQEKAKGAVIPCPKCRKLSFQFKELVPNSYYARICSVCEHYETL